MSERTRKISARKSVPDAPRTPTPSLRWRDSSPFDDPSSTPPVPDLPNFYTPDQSHLDADNAFMRPRNAPARPGSRPYSAAIDPDTPYSSVPSAHTTPSVKYPETARFAQKLRPPPLAPKSVHSLHASPKSSIHLMSPPDSAGLYPETPRSLHFPALPTHPPRVPPSIPSIMLPQCFDTPAPPPPSKVYPYPAVASADSSTRSLRSRVHASLCLPPEKEQERVGTRRRLQLAYMSYSVFSRAISSLVAVLILGLGLRSGLEETKPIPRPWPLPVCLQYVYQEKLTVAVH